MTSDTETSAASGTISSGFRRIAESTTSRENIIELAVRFLDLIEDENKATTRQLQTAKERIAELQDIVQGKHAKAEAEPKELVACRQLLVEERARRRAAEAQLDECLGELREQSLLRRAAEMELAEQCRCDEDVPRIGSLESLGALVSAPLSNTQDIDGALKKLQSLNITFESM